MAGFRRDGHKFDRENIDELLEIRQIRQYFPSQKFAPYGIHTHFHMYIAIHSATHN